MPRPTRWKGCVNGLKGRVRACFICPPIRLTSTPSKWPAPKLSSSCARLKRALWKHSMRRLLRPYKLFLRAMLKASSSMSDSVYDPYGNRYIMQHSYLIVVTLRAWWVNWWGLSRHYNTCLGQVKTGCDLRAEELTTLTPLKTEERGS